MDFGRRSEQKFAAFVAFAIGSPAQLKVALDISALPVSLFEVQANLIARKGSLARESVMGQKRR